MKRRDFLKTSVVAGAALSLNFEGLQAALSSNTLFVYCHICFHICFL